MPSVSKSLLALAALAETGALDWSSMEPGTISFKHMGICGTGEDSYVGMIEPAEVTEPTKVFIEIMGGAICFSKESCTNSYIGTRTMSINSLMVDHLGVPAEMISMLTSGMNIPLAMLQPLSPGFLPYPGVDHPMSGRRGVFMISCTGDINLGRRNVTYTPRAAVGNALTTCDETSEGNGENYRGCQNRTQSGFACSPWDQRSGVTEDHNYCRNPQGISGLWCHTALADAGFRWDYCEPVGADPVLYHAHHLGGLSMQMALDSFERDFDSITEVSLYGGSGGGVSSVAWAPVVADQFPDAQVRVLADSALHVFPGNGLFHAFYDIALWGPGPVGQGDGVDAGVQVPDFDWREIDAVAAHIASFEGRVKVAYFGCVDDSVVYNDRLIMGSLAGLGTHGIPGSREQLTSRATQHEDTWRFLSAMHKCSEEFGAPQTVYSYIQNCSRHAQTIGQNWDVAVPGDVSPQQFVFNFLSNTAPDGGDANKTNFWYEDRPSAADDVTCCSAVRRRRGVAATATDSTSTCASIGDGNSDGNSDGSAEGNSDGQEEMDSSSLPLLPGALALVLSTAAVLVQ